MRPPNEIYGEGVAGEDNIEWTCADGEGLLPLLDTATKNPIVIEPDDDEL